MSRPARRVPGGPARVGDRRPHCHGHPEFVFLDDSGPQPEEVPPRRRLTASRTSTAEDEASDREGTHHRSGAAVVLALAAPVDYGAVALALPAFGG
ncbi:hypothetical protein [Streptomyces solaniscabiei]|uniref:hypothetical protein n=1 Tax=Streptomyces solaniscabiei TaxID=2683255 RepID=UPI001CE24962|nr:hypothetical protein [Streptomyces solaniscabiei]